MLQSLSCETRTEDCCYLTSSCEVVLHWASSASALHPSPSVSALTNRSAQTWVDNVATKHNVPHQQSQNTIRDMQKHISSKTQWHLPLSLTLVLWRFPKWNRKPHLFLKTNQKRNQSFLMENTTAYSNREICTTSGCGCVTATDNVPVKTITTKCHIQQPKINMSLHHQLGIKQSSQLLLRLIND